MATKEEICTLSRQYLPYRLKEKQVEALEKLSHKQHSHLPSNVLWQKHGAFDVAKYGDQR